MQLNGKKPTHCLFKLLSGWLSFKQTRNHHGCLSWKIRKYGGIFLSRNPHKTVHFSPPGTFIKVNKLKGQTPLCRDHTNNYPSSQYNQGNFKLGRPCPPPPFSLRKQREETMKKKITVLSSFNEKSTDQLGSRGEVVASGQIFKDDVKGFSSNSDICFMEMSEW